MRNALKGNDRIGLIKLFHAFFTKALRTDGPTHALIEMRGRILKLTILFLKIIGAVQLYYL